MGEIIADVELESAADHELAKAGHLEDGEVRRATVRIGVECTAPTAGNGDRATDRIGSRYTAPSSGDGGP